MRNAFLVALVLVAGVGRPIAAQEVARPTAKCAPHLGSAGVVVEPIRENGQSEASARTRFGGVDRGPGGQPGATDSFGPWATQAEAGDSRGPVASLGALSSRVKPTDRIYVRRTSGEEIVGRFSRASETSLTLEIHGQAQEIPASEVQQVSRRGGNRVGKGMLFGFLTGAAVAVTAMTTSGSESDWSAGDKILFGTLAGGGAGLIWGGVIGAFVHEHPVVYRASAPAVRLAPVFSRDGAGVILVVRF